MRIFQPPSKGGLVSAHHVVSSPALNMTPAVDRPAISRALMETANVSPTRAATVSGSATSATTFGETASRITGLVMPAALAVRSVSPTDKVVMWPRESTLATAGLLEKYRKRVGSIEES